MSELLLTITGDRAKLTRNGVPISEMPALGLGCRVKLGEVEGEIVSVILQPSEVCAAIAARRPVHLLMDGHVKLRNVAIEITPKGESS